MDEMTLTLNSPITEEQWDMITDVDFDHTDSITFHTKHGKEVEFVKRKTGKWTPKEERQKQEIFICSECGGWAYSPWIGSRKNPKPNRCKYNFCPNCGAKMEGLKIS